MDDRQNRCLHLLKQEDPKMDKRKIGKLEMSAVSLGCMGITHASSAPMSVKDGVKVIEQAYNMGYALFDTAECYTGINPDGSIAYNEEMVRQADRRQPPGNHPQVGGGQPETLTLTCIISTALPRTCPRRK